MSPNNYIRIYYNVNIDFFLFLKSIFHYSIWAIYSVGSWSLEVELL